MGAVNFYFIHMNPCLVYFSEEKSRIIKNTFECYKEKIDKKATLGEVRLFSFSPKSNELYSDILECYMPFMKSPSVLVCYSAFDIAPSNRAAYGRISFALNSNKIKTMYFHNYDPKNDVRTYMDKILNVFKYSTDSLEKTRVRGETPQSALHNSELINDILELRLSSPPVRYEDLSKVSGISISTLRKKGRFYDNSNSIGEKINNSQKEYILEKVRSFYFDSLEKYNTIEETFYP